MIVMFYIFVGFIAWIFIAIACAWMAGRKGQNWLAWGFIGLLLGPFAIAILAGSKFTNPAKDEEIDSANPTG